MLAAAVLKCSQAGKPAVMASWERPASSLRPLFPTAAIEVLGVMGWSIDELERGLRNAAVPRGALIAVDDLQLITGPEDACAQLARVAQEMGLAVLLGAIAPRAVSPLLESGAPAAQVLRSLTTAMLPSGALTPIHRVAVILNQDPTRRHFVISHPAPKTGMVAAVL